MEDIQHLQYPVGRFNYNEFISQTDIDTCISIIAAFPANLDELIAPMTANQLDMPYRPGGWNVRQVVHHCADSHMNAYIRHKLTMTEDCPTILPYNEKLWAEMPDVQHVAIKEGCLLLRLLHQRWSFYLSSLPYDSLSKSYLHPEKKRKINMYESIGMYSFKTSFSSH